METKTELIYLNALLLVLFASNMAIIWEVKLENPLLNVIFLISLAAITLIGTKIKAISKRLSKTAPPGAKKPHAKHAREKIVRRKIVLREPDKKTRRD